MKQVKYNLPMDKTLEILMKYIREVDGTSGIASDVLAAYGDGTSIKHEPEKKIKTFTEEQLLDIIAALPQPGGYIHIDDLTKAINNHD